jgi:hypothetical protein
MQVRETPEDYVEVYSTDDQVEAFRLVDAVLRPAGIEAVIRDRMAHALPAPASQPGGYFIAVPAADRDRALELIEADHD